VPSVSITQVDDNTDDTQLGVNRASSLSAGSDAAGPSSWSRGEARHRSNSIQTTPTGSPTGSRPNSPQLSPAHRPSPSQGSIQGSIQPDWHFAAALENAITPPGSPRLTGDGGLGRSRASSAVSQSDLIMDSFGTSAWGESMRRSVTTHRRTSDNNRRPSNPRQHSGSRQSSAQRRPSAPRQYSSSSRPPSPSPQQHWPSS
jgi:hypothetical protein